MTKEQAKAAILSAIAVTRENIARAKAWVLAHKGTNTAGMVDEWLQQQNASTPRAIDGDASNVEQLLEDAARSYSIKLAFFQAIWELIASSDLFHGEGFTKWDPNLDYTTRGERTGFSLHELNRSFPTRIDRPWSSSALPVDPDIFLKGIDSKTLHDGIQEAIEQSLACFKRGLYLPATAMLAAAAEATWTECGAVVATKLGSASLQNLLANEPSFGKLVAEIRKALQPKTAKALLESAGKTIHNIEDAEIWTTTLRERRNALHWGKSKSFIADHSETASLLMGAPLHLQTLEAIRIA